MPASMAAWMVEMLSASSLGAYMPDMPMQPSARADTGGAPAPSGLVIMSNRLTGSGKRPDGVAFEATDAANWSSGDVHYLGEVLSRLIAEYAAAVRHPDRAARILC